MLVITSNPKTKKTFIVVLLDKPAICFASHSVFS